MYSRFIFAKVPYNTNKGWEIWMLYIAAGMGDSVSRIWRDSASAFADTVWYDNPKIGANRNK